MSESNTMHKIVDSKNGKIRGIRQTTLFEKLDFYAFKGMNYGLTKPNQTIIMKLSIFARLI